MTTDWETAERIAVNFSPPVLPTEFEAAAWQLVREVLAAARASSPPAWRKEPPEPMEAYECRWWWVKFVLDDGRVSWCEPRGLGAPPEYDLYCSRKPARGHFEFLPCAVPGASPPSPGLVEAVERHLLALDAYQHGVPGEPQYAAAIHALRDTTKALRAALPKEPTND
jgi:hypothetical protein